MILMKTPTFHSYVTLCYLDDEPMVDGVGNCVEETGLIDISMIHDNTNFIT